MKLVLHAIAMMALVLTGNAYSAVYCDSSSNMSMYEWVDAVTINGSPYYTGNNGGYISHSTPQYIDSDQIALTMTSGFGYGTYSEKWGVWVDWNQDGIFDGSEQVYTGTTANTETLSTIIPVPMNAMLGDTTMRVVMSWGNDPQACGTYYYGETEDFVVTISATSSTPPPDLLPQFSLSVAPDYTVYRNGPVDANLFWVVEKDGAIVLESNATYNMSERYYLLTEGSQFRIWLNDYTGQQVSNTIEFTVGETFSHQLSVDNMYNLKRSGSLGEPLQWMIEQDGVLVMIDDASATLDYVYSGNIPGTHIRAWLMEFINGQEQRVSNYVEYDVGALPAYEISIDQSHRIMRTGYQGEPVQWRIDRDGLLYGYADASFDLQWIDYDNAPGSMYMVTLVTTDGMDTPVSNTIQYVVDDLPLTHMLDFINGTLIRSGSLGEPLGWVIEEDGRIVLDRAADSELQYVPSIMSGKKYRFWLNQFIDGGYQRVSNIVTLTDANQSPPPVPPPAMPFTISVDDSYTVYRTGPLDANLTWVVERDGVIALQANATYSMQTHNDYGGAGTKYRVWLNDNTGTQVSNIIEYTIGETFNYQLSVDPYYGLHRSGILGDNLTWVIEKDWATVLERDAASELDYTYYNNTPGSYVRVWLRQYINGQYQRVSNYVEYIVDSQPAYELTLDQSHRVMRTGYLGEPVMWHIERDGGFYTEVEAGTNLQWVDYENVPGATYSITLVTMDGMATPVSNTVQYTVDDLPTTYSLDLLDGYLMRSGIVGESIMYWVIEENGHIILKRYASNELQYMPTISSGSQYRFWLEKYVDGGYQRVSNIVTVMDASALPQPTPTLLYDLSVGADYTTYRNGPLDAAPTWVIEKDGAIVLQYYGKYVMHHKYWLLSPGSKFRIWLTESGAQVSNIIEFTVDETFSHQLSVDSIYGLHRSGMLGEDLTWVIERDGVVVLERNAANELDYTYFNNAAGSLYRVWLKQPINGQYQRVSNYIDYTVGVTPSYEVLTDQSHRVIRTGYLGEPLLWKVEVDGALLDYFDASFSMQWVDYTNIPGATYTVSLVAMDGLYTPVSNVVTYTVDDIVAAYSLSFTNNTLSRSGSLGENLTWVIERDGEIVLQRNATNELQYSPTIYTGAQYRFWLLAPIDGGYQRVSNIVTLQ